MSFNKKNSEELSQALSEGFDVILHRITNLELVLTQRQARTNERLKEIEAGREESRTTRAEGLSGIIRRLKTLENDMSRRQSRTHERLKEIEDFIVLNKLKADGDSILSDFKESLMDDGPEKVKEQCSTCRWSVHHGDIYTQDSGERVALGFLECHGRPPSCSGGFPKVNDSDFCKEWEPKS